MQSSALFDEDGHQPDDCHDKHGDESGELSKYNGEQYESDKRHTDGQCCQREEASTDAHEFKRFLQSLEYGKSLLIHRHSIVTSLLFEEQRKSLGKRDEGDTAADGEHDGLLHVLVAV